MTYGIAFQLDEGLVTVVDSRTHAGVDHLAVYHKLHLFERPGERALALMTAGNLSMSQSVVNLLTLGVGQGNTTLMDVPTMLDAARLIGAAIREADRLDGQSLRAQNIDYHVVMTFGGQIAGGDMRLFQIYSAGNFIESTPDTPFFLIGELKYGKPIIDRVITRTTSLADATKCALISMDSTLRSNASVGLPLDLAAIRRDSLKIDVRRRIEEGDPYFTGLRQRWGEGLRSVFSSIPNPVWSG